MECFMFFFHVLHNFQFYRGKTGHSNGIMSKSPFKRTSSCKWRCQHAGKHLLGRNKTTAQNGKPKPHAALYACIYLEYAGYFGMIYVFFVFVMFEKKSIGITCIYLEYVEYYGMLYVVCIFCNGLQNHSRFDRGITCSTYSRYIQVILCLYKKEIM